MNGGFQLLTALASDWRVTDEKQNTDSQAILHTWFRVGTASEVGSLAERNNSDVIAEVHAH